MSDSALATVQGYYISDIMRDHKNGFTVFRLNTGKEIVVCTGNVVLPCQGMRVEAQGVWTGTKYGKQLSVESLTVVYTDKAGMLEYLKTIPNIGERTAKALIDHFGNDLYTICKGSDGVSQLQAVKGVTQEKAECIIEFFQRTDVYRDLFDVIVRKHGGAYSVVPKIYKEYGASSMEALQNDPYSIGIRFGIPFAVVDSIAKSYNLKILSPVRVIGAVSYSLRRGLSCGHCYLYYNDIFNLALKAVNAGEYDEALTTACIYNGLLDNKHFVIEQDKVYLKSVYFDEVKTAHSIRRLCKDAIPIQGHTYEELVRVAEESVGCSYAEQQKEAFGLLLKGGIGIITGGPGTGKSTVIKGLLAAYRSIYPDKTIKLCAPTGRAAQRMKEVCQMPATTIHKLLEYHPFGDTVTCKNEGDPIDADLLVIDECSMISLDIAVLLFAAIRSGTQVIMCGDIYQLPSVGAGNILKDMIESKMIPTVMLTKTYRQAEDSLIITNANRIKSGLTSLAKGKDFEIMVAEDEDIPSVVKSLFEKYNDPNDAFALQVLTPGRRKWASASHELSKTLQATRTFGGQVLRYGDVIFHCGDKVIFNKNNYDVGYFNGDIGIIKGITDDGMDVFVDEQIIYIPEDCLEDIALAYSITIHKSQGSEYNTAIVVLPTRPANMLQRNLLYTAITRAKKKCILVAARGTIQKAVNNKDCTKRNSSLAQRIALS